MPSHSNHLSPRCTSPNQRKKHEPIETTRKKEEGMEEWEWRRREERGQTVYLVSSGVLSITLKGPGVYVTEISGLRCGRYSQVEHLYRGRWRVARGGEGRRGEARKSVGKRQQVEVTRGDEEKRETRGDEWRTTVRGGEGKVQGGKGKQKVSRKIKGEDRSQGWEVKWDWWSFARYECT